jgi:D-alanyl-D-alanine carboxypeptidase/D-alanyl-D-alanine-endopeptidase (penicillin-binding protein 4)
MAGTEREGRTGGKKGGIEGEARLRFGHLALLALLSPLSPLSTAAQPARAPLAERIAAVLDDPAFADAHWGALVLDLETGDTLFARNAGRRFIPASNAKLFATAGALALLGPDYRYETTLYFAGEVRDGTLHGDLILRGSGDPTLGTGRFADPGADPGQDLAVFRAWADSLAALGVTRVTGAVVGDDDVFDDVPYGLGWAWDDLAYGYAAEVSGLTFREGTVGLTVRGTQPGRPAALAWEPLRTPYVSFVNRTTTRAAGEAVEEGYARDLSRNRFTVTTAVPADGADTEALAVHNPTRYTADTFRRVLLDRGIAVEGGAEDVDDRPERPDYSAMARVATARSPALAEIVRETNVESNNLYAEHLLRTLGVLHYRGDEAAHGSAEAGVLALRPVLEAAGIAPASIQLVDGSGLSFMDRVTPRALVRLLAFLHGHPDPAVRAAFYASLPVGGESGTLEGRYPSGDARGNVRAKTGSINGVRALSGYVTSANGHPLAFALLANHYGAPRRRIDEAQDTVVELLADYEGP